MTTLADHFNVHFSWMQYMDFFVRILLACISGACIGFERSKRLKEAGIRTHIIVCFAAALMMVVSKYGFVDIVGAQGAVFNGVKEADPSRIASQVVSGVSFLGAGVIFKHGSSIKGLTTAAGIWATAGIGLALGAGMYVLGIFSVVVMVLLQIMMHHFLPHLVNLTISHLSFTLQTGEDFKDKLGQYLIEQNIQVMECAVTYEDDDKVSVDMMFRAPEEISLHEWHLFLDKHGKTRSINYTPVT